MRKILKSQSQYSTKVGTDCGNVVEWSAVLTK